MIQTMKQTGFSSFAAETLVFFVLAAYESKLKNLYPEN